MEQGRRRVTWMRRVDSRSKDGQGECHTVGWGQKSSFGSAGYASAGVTNWTPDFVRSLLVKKTVKQSVLLERIPAVPICNQHGLLLFCAAPRSNFWLRTVPPELVEAFATAHDVGAVFVRHHAREWGSAKESASLPLCMGGLGLRSAFRSRQAAHWASWCECLEMIRDRCFRSWGMLMDRLTSRQQEQPHSIAAAREFARCLERDGFDVPTWEDLTVI